MNCISYNKPVAAMLTLALCFAASAYSTFGQTSAAPATDPPIPTEPLHTVIPVHLDPATGDIKVGRTTYHGTNPGLHMLALKRQQGQALDTADLIQDQVFTDANSVNSFLQNVLAKNSDAFLIVNGVGNYGVALSEIAKNLEQFGGQVDLEAITNSPPFIFIGNGGRNKGGARERGYDTRTLDGYLATDSNGNYTFIQTDYVQYDITTDGTIKIGGTTYTVADSYKPGCNGETSNSFHVLIVDRESLQPIQVNNTYCTAQSDSEIGRLASDIPHVIGNNEGLLIFIASNGHPIPANWNFGTDGDGRIYPLAQEIAQLGGYFETMVYLTPSDTYSLVGAPAPPSWVSSAWSRAREASSVYPDHPSGGLHGVLARGRANWYSPIDADLTGKANLDFYDQVLAQQPAQPEATFPQYASGSDELKAFQYISTQLCGQNCNPRNNYEDTNISIHDYLTELQSITDPNNNNADCTKSANAGLTFCQVWQQLSTEFQYVDGIRSFASNLSQLGTINGVDSLFDLISTWQTVQATLPPPPQPTAPSLVSPIVNLVLGLGVAAPTPLAPLFGIADTFFNFGMSLTTDQSGNQTASLATPVANLANQAQANFHGQLSTLGTQFDLIYEDWGKMKPLGSFLASGQQAWSWGQSTASDISLRMNPAVKQGMYQSLMSAVYAIGSYLPTTPSTVSNGWGYYPLARQPNAYRVLVNRSSPYTPLSQPFDIPAYIPYTYPTDTGNQWADDPRTATLLSDYSWLGISAINTPVTGTTDNFQYQPPTEDLRTQLFNPVSKGGLGVYRPAFFHSWAFPRVNCDLSFGDYNGYTHPGGCFWNTGTPPVEALPGPLTNVSIKVDRLCGYGNRMELRLAIRNNGTNDITSMEISEIGLRPLDGHGDAKLLDSLPIYIDNLTPNKPAIVVLHVEVPHSVEKLKLTETGTVNSGAGSLDDFILNQVISTKKCE